MEKNGKVLVLGNDERAFLTVIRSLGRKDIEVHAGWCPKCALALRSRYVKAVHHLPSYNSEGNDWKTALTSLMRREDYDLVIPCHDQMIIPLQSNADEIKKSGNIYLLNDKSFKVVNSKVETTELARELGIPVPRDKRISKYDQSNDIIKYLKFPLILKPISSFSPENLVAKRYVRRVYTVQELYLKLNEMLPKGDILVQENFIGKGVGIEVLAKHGNVLVAFQHLRVHEPLSGGGSSYRKSVLVSPELMKEARKFIEAIEYTGVAMIEFKLNTKSNQFILVEVNGRFWGSLPLAVSAGVDFPYYLYQMLVKGKNTFNVNYYEDVYCRNMSRDLVWMKDNLKANHADPNLDTLPWSVVASEIKNIIRLREHSDTFVIDDPLPGVLEIGRLGFKAIARLNAMIRKKAMESTVIRKYFRKNLDLKIVHSKRFAFVCKGNICRSPFAENYAKNILPDYIDVMSFGYYPENDRKSTDYAVQAASEIGVDLRAHRSRVLQEDNVREADVLFTFDSENRQTLLDNYPWAKAKIIPLGLIDMKRNLFIADPYGKDLETYRATYRHITYTIHELNLIIRKKHENDE